MCRPSITLLVILIAISDSAFAADWNSLVHQYTDLSNSRLKLSRETLGETEYNSQLAVKRDQSAELADQFVTLIENTGADNPVRYMAIELVITDRFAGEASFLVADMIPKTELDSPHLINTIRTLGFGYPGASPGGEKALRGILAASSDVEVTTMAKLSLACLLRRKIEEAAAVQRLAVRREFAICELGSTSVDHLVNIDIQAMRLEATSLLNEVQSKLDGRKWGETPLNTIAERELDTVKNHTIGCSVADVIGKDTSGRPLRLSDFNNRVRVLLFWGHWCVGCRTAYPLYRSLVSDFPESDFCFLGIDSDRKLETIRSAIDDGQITWRCWWDGEMEPMPIHTDWNQVGAPHLFVLDRLGRIAFVNIRREELREAVELLIATKD